MLGSFLASHASAGTTTSLAGAYADGLLSSTASADLYDDWYLFRPSVGSNGFTAIDDRVRRVASYEPGTGTLTPDAAWLVAPSAPTIFAAGEAFELHGLIEPYVAMASCINEGLKRCFLTKETTLTPVALAQRHSLATAAWIDEPWKVRSVGFLSSGQVRAQVNPYAQTVRGYVSNEGGTFYLNHPGYTFNTTDTLYVWTVARHYDVCLTGSTPQTGLILETDTATAPLDWVARAALIEAFERFSTLLDPSSNQRLLTNQAQCAAAFSSLRKQNFQLPPLTFEPLVSLGPLPSYAGYY